MRKLVLLAGVAALALSGVATAQSPAKSKSPAARSAASIECSRQADAKGLHGKPRKSFRSRCIRKLSKKTPL
jgi:hypothetical protein